MSILAPFYIAGILAVAMPILFHLIRRTPQHRQSFGSLMFLAPSPPRLSRRSRLTNILLLILRAAALTLLAIAFARPFFYRNADINIPTIQGKRLALLVDTSASMRRGDLWQQAQKRVDQTLADVSPGDEVALFLFDRTVRPAFTFEEWNQSEPSQRIPLLRAQLNKASPTWASTNLGEALASLADQLAESHNSESGAGISGRQITLISDLQQGSHMEALQGHEWPEGVLLDVKPVSISQGTDASLQLIKPTTDSEDPHPDQPRIRVTNQNTSSGDQFTVTWANAQKELPGIAAQKVYAPAGHSQVIRMPWPSLDQHADRLILRGGDFDFDNTLYLDQPTRQTERIVYIGDDASDDPKALSYYLSSMLINTPQQKTDFIQRRAEALTDADLNDAGLVVVSSSMPDDRTRLIRQFAEGGGTVLWVLKDIKSLSALAQVAKNDSLPSSFAVDESSDSNFALIARVDTANPLFTLFADPRFADFSKIHFWKHRRVQLSNESSARAIAWFDNGDPFLIEQPIGQGRLVLAASGWQPADSQLALSTKFVPLIGGLIKHPDSSINDSRYFVGDTLPGNVTADHPGIYLVQLDGKPIAVAVNLAPDESRTAPLAAADLAQWGAHVGTQVPPEVLVAKQRQLKLFELENRQKMWRWLLIAVLGLAGAETVLAGRLANRASALQLENGLEPAITEQVTT